jgi:ribosome-binding factor A
MNEHEIRHERNKARLIELMTEALGSLTDDRINAFEVTKVDLKRGKYDAVIYLNGKDAPKEKRQQLHALLAKASGHIKQFCIESGDWYRMPSLTFKFDDSMELNNNLEALFDKIKKKDS